MTATINAGADAPNLSLVTPADDARTILINKVSWGAILAGVVTALVSQLILNMIGIGIGASTLDPMTNDNPAASTFSIGAGIWWALSGIVASFVGGYVASRLSGRPKETTGGWHGLTTWAATTLLIFYLLSTAVGSLVGGAFSTVSGALGGLGRTAGSAIQTAAPALASTTDPLAFLNQAVRTSTGNDPAALREDATSAIRDLLTGDASRANDARERAAQALARSQNIPVEEARTRVASYEKQYRDTVETTKRQAVQDRIEADRRAKAELGIDARRQSERQVRQTLALGTTAIRSHVDVDTEIGTANVAGVLATRDAWRDLVPIQVVAFPQSGMLIRPGTLALMEEAMRMGADVVGGIDPAAIDRDPVAHLDAVFALADRFGKPVDLHLHEPGDLGAFVLELVVERTRALGMAGRVLASHAYGLGALPPAAHDRLVSQLAEAGIAVMTAGPPGTPCPALKPLRAAGVTLCGGSDGPRGTWSPYGRGDMLARATAIAERNGFTRDEDLALALEACTTGGATAIGLADHGLSPGDRADLVLLDVETVAEAVAAPPVRRLVMAGGRIVARDGVLTDGI